MTIKEIIETQNNIRKSLASIDVISAMSRLSRFIEQSGGNGGSMRERLGTLMTSFNYMLKFYAAGNKDVTRKQFVADTITRLYELTDECVLAQMTPQSTDLFYTRRKQPIVSTLDELFTDYRQTENKIRLLEHADGDANRAVIDNLRRHLEAVEVTVFNSVWTAFPLTWGQTDLLRLELTADDLPEPFAALILSALLLGITKFYDDNKLSLLADVYERWHEQRFALAARALVAIVITLFCYRSRLRWNTVALNHLDSLAALTHWQSDLKAAVIRLSRARNTENISRSMDTDLIPDIRKISPDLLRNMRSGKDPGAVMADMEENPEWQQWLKESNLGDKLRRFNDMQLEGDDVYASTFSRFKSFPFFNTLANWFMPFHHGHSVVCGDGDDSRVAMARMLEGAPLMCNNDKYSIFLSIASMPRQQQSLLSHQFEQQRLAMKEMENAEMLPELTRRDNLINIYIQDLYRFFKLYSRRREFYAVFNETFNVLNAPRGTLDAIDDETIATIAEYYFKNGFYDDAVDYYNHILAGGGDPRLYQKIGYARQRQGRYADAIEAYRKYQLVRDNDVWTIRHIAACYLATGNSDSAINCYRRALDLAPENVSTIMNLAKVLLDTGSIAEALKLYYKADVLDEKNYRARRAIAWCSLLLGNYEQSGKYYQRIIADGSTNHADYMNYGHLLLIRGQAKDAIEHYGKCIRRLATVPNQQATPAEWFVELANEDREIVVQAGVDPMDFSLALQAATEFTECEDITDKF